MKIAIMQPYFFPYLGYFQLINAVDRFVVYDNVEYTKKGWINRNRILLNGKECLFTVPLAKSSDFLTVKERYIADTFDHERRKILGQIRSAYCKAPCFQQVYPLLEAIFNDQEKNLFDFVFHSIGKVLSFLEIPTPVVIASSVPVDHRLKGVEKVLAICRELSATTYINPIGGIGIYTKKVFEEQGIDLHFHQMIVTPYTQQADSFISHLSIIDVMMNNSREQVMKMLDRYDLLEPERAHFREQHL